MSDIRSSTLKTDPDCVNVAGTVAFDGNIGRDTKSYKFGARFGITPVAPEIVKTVYCNQNAADEFYKDIIGNL